MERIAPMLALARLQAENRTSPFSVLLIICLPRRSALLLLWIRSNNIAARSFFPRLKETETCVYLYITTCTSRNRYEKRYELAEIDIFEKCRLPSSIEKRSTLRDISKAGVSFPFFDNVSFTVFNAE